MLRMGSGLKKAAIVKANRGLKNRQLTVVRHDRNPERGHEATECELNWEVLGRYTAERCQSARFRAGKDLGRDGDRQQRCHGHAGVHGTRAVGRQTMRRPHRHLLAGIGAAGDAVGSRLTQERALVVPPGLERVIQTCLAHPCLRDPNE